MMNDRVDRRRRSFFLGRLADEVQGSAEHHIVSLVVHSLPDKTDAVSEILMTLEGVEIHARDPSGKLILTLETPDDSGIVALMGAIQSIPGVLSAALVFHHFEQPTQRA